MSRQPDPHIVVCDGTELALIESHVRHALAGDAPRPLFVVGPHVSPEQALSEVRRVGYPAGTGVLMRTSGSTSGTGKIVALSWQSLFYSAQATHRALAGPGRWLADLPLFHIAGFQTIVRSVLAGLPALHMSLGELLAQGSLTALSQLGDPIYCSVVPTQLSRIVSSPELLEAARQLIFLVGGGPTSPLLLGRAHAAGLEVHTSYGMTETCGGCVYDGHPIGDARIRISDRNQISITGSMVALGYLPAHEDGAMNDVGDGASIVPASASAPQIIPSLPPISQHTHHTRDLGEFSSDGVLRILGRIDDAITTGGLTIIPRIIEEVVEAQLAHTTVVVGIDDDEWGQSAIAIVDMPADRLDAETHYQVRSKVKSILGAGWQPRKILPLSALQCQTWPQTPSGKIDRRTIAELTSLYFLHGNIT